jgi:predicted nucleic acid-binding protein
MRLVVDANIFIAAFLKNALTRELLLDERLDLATPEYGFIETRAILKRPNLLKRLRLSPDNFEWLWSVLTARVKVISQADCQTAVQEAQRLISDLKDVPYLACALILRAAVWSNDPHFQAQKLKRRVEVFTTGELIAQLKR